MRRLRGEQPSKRPDYYMRGSDLVPTALIKVLGVKLRVMQELSS